MKSLNHATQITILIVFLFVGIASQAGAVVIISYSSTGGNGAGILTLTTIDGCSALGTATYSSGTITVNSGSANTLCSVYMDIDDPAVLSKSGNEYVLNANVVVNPDVTLNIEGDTLKFNGPYYLHNKGTLNINGSVITSVEQSSSTTNRGFVWNSKKRYANGFKLSLTNSEVSYLGRPGTISITDVGNVEIKAFQVGGDGDTSLRDGGAADPPIINNNSFHHNYRALFANGGGDVVTNNTISYNDGDTIVDVSSASLFDNNELSYHTDSVTSYLVITWGGPTQISNNYFHHNSRGPMIWTKNGVNGAVIKNNLFENNSAGNARIIVVAEVRETWTYIENNTIDGNSKSYGIVLEANGNYINRVSPPCGYTVKTIVRNNTINGGDKGIVIGGDSYFKYCYSSHGAEAVRVYNNSITNSLYGIDIEADNHNDSIIYDNVIIGSTGADIRMGSMYVSGNMTPIMINNQYSSTIVGSGKIYDYKLLDVMVVDINENPVNNAAVTVANNIDANYPSINIDGQTKTSFSTGANGHTPLLSDPANSAAILDFYQTSSSQQEMTYTITAEKDGKTASLSGLDIDESWYREDPNQPTKTVVLNIDTGSGYVETNYVIDLDQNGVINILDIVIVAQHFGESTTCPDACPAPNYDIDSNGSVDILDIRLVAEGM